MQSLYYKQFKKLLILKMSFMFFFKYIISKFIYIFFKWLSFIKNFLYNFFNKFLLKNCWIFLSVVLSFLFLYLKRNFYLIKNKILFLFFINWRKKLPFLKFFFDFFSYFLESAFSWIVSENKIVWDSSYIKNLRLYPLPKWILRLKVKHFLNFFRLIETKEKEKDYI